MAPFTLDLEKTTSRSMTVALEPAFNAFVSGLLIEKNVGDPGIHEWVERVRSQMSAEEQGRHSLVMTGFFYAAVPRNSWDNFSVYLDYLERRPPSAFRETLLDSYSGIFMKERAKNHLQEKVNWNEVLSTTSNYLSFLKDRFGDEHIDEEIESRAYQYVIDPDAMKQLIVGHLRWFWKNHLEKEWSRVQPMLLDSVKAFTRVDLNNMSRIEAARFITGQELQEEKWAESLERAEKVIFIPNAHIGPYLQRSYLNDTFYIFFGARQPEGEEVRIPELERTEIVSRLSALADDTRMRILRMVIEHGEMRSQEVIDATGLSQPSVSRYLAQLSATGYLHERRENGSKIYAVNFDRIEKTLKAVSAFLRDRS